MAGWRSIWEERGAQSAATDGGMKTLLWPVDSWAKGERIHMLTHLQYIQTSLILLLSSNTLGHRCKCYYHLAYAFYMADGMKCPSEMSLRAWGNFGGNFKAFIMLHALFLCVIFPFKTPIPEKYLTTISALLFTLLPISSLSPFLIRMQLYITFNVVMWEKQLMFYVPRKHLCRPYFCTNSWHVLTLTPKLVCTMMCTHALVCIYTGEWVKVLGEREENRRQITECCILVIYATLLIPDWHVLNVIFQDVKSCTGNSPVFSSEHQSTLEWGSLQRRWIRSAPVSKDHLEWRGVYSGCSRHMYTAARLSLPPWHVFE